MSSVYLLIRRPGRELRRVQHPVANRPVREARCACTILGYWIAQSRKMAHKINFQPYKV
jgi:arginyl-tRNA--protein-N-Asp/Glu arginylyltransferase